MTQPPPQRRLAAILAADVVGWSRLVRADEEGALARLKALRRELIDPALARRSGRIVKLMGDGMLVEFASAVDAVRCAIEVQEAMARRNAGAEEAARIAFRIGVNLGDVVIDGDDLHGDGVNLAARLEAEAPEGGLCVSAAVHEQARDRVDVVFEDLGPLSLKNIDRPVPAWGWTPGAVAAATPAEVDAAPALPEKPSIAVLPFDNMSRDPEHEFFADGVVEDIITALSRIEAFFVVARNSSFTYKGRSVDVQQVGRDLGVAYVLEGSVRAAGQRLRVTAQLIDARTGAHVWAERYDREMADVFDVQDEITRNVVASTQTQITIAAGDAAAAQDSLSLPVWSLVNQAWSLTYRMREVDLRRALELAEHAAAMDPAAGAAQMMISVSRWHLAWLGHSDDPPADIAAALEAAEKAVRLSPRSEFARWMLGLSRLRQGRHDEAIAELERAIELNPNCSLAYGSLATILNFSGQPDRAIVNNEIALRMNPRDPSSFYRFAGLAISYWMIGRLEEAASWARKTLQDKPDFPQPHLLLIAALQEADAPEAAAAALAEMRARLPAVSLADAAALPFRLPEHRDRLVAALRAAGLPEAPA